MFDPEFLSSTTDILKYVGTCSVLIGMLVVAVTTDVDSRRIPNWLTYSVAGAALFLATACRLAGLDHVFIDPAASLKGLIVCFGVMVIAYCVANVGAGDVKLSAAIGALVGSAMGLEIIVLAHVTAGLFALSRVIRLIGLRWFVQRALSFAFPARFEQPMLDRETLNYPVPMAVFFSIGTVLALGGVHVL